MFRLVLATPKPFREESRSVEGEGLPLNRTLDNSNRETIHTFEKSTFNLANFVNVSVLAKPDKCNSVIFRKLLVIGGSDFWIRNIYFHRKQTF